MTWDDENIARLECLWREGLPTNEIARRMGVSKNAIVGKAHRLDLPSRPTPIIRDGRPNLSKPKDKPRRSPRQTLPPLPVHPSIPSVPKYVAPPPPKLIGRVSQCCYVLNDNKPWKFCDDPTLPGKTMCNEHHQRCFVRVRDRSEDALA